MFLGWEDHTLYSPHTAEVFRPSYKLERIGNPLAQLPTVALKSFKGFLQPASAKDQQVYLQDNVIVSHTYYTFADPELQLDDILKIKGRYFWINGIRNACELDQAWMVDLTEYYGVAKV